MAYELVKISNSQNECKSVWIVLILSLCAFLFINNLFTKREHFTLNKNNKLKTNTKSDKKIFIEPILSSYNIGTCSKNCCATQWPVPIDFTERSGVKKSDVGYGKKYTASNLTCNNGVRNTGCVCLTDKTKKLLGNRGYVKELPQGNGLLNQDYRVSAFKIMEDKVQPAKVLGQTEELTGRKSDSLSLSGKNINRHDTKLDRYRSVSEAKELSEKYAMPINTNMIAFDNIAINNALIESSNISGNHVSDLDRFMSDRLGMNTQGVSVNRK
jgi:hypothetical protein